MLGRKRVRFAAEDMDEQLSLDQERPPKRRIIDLVPLSTELSEREKRDRWIQPGEWGGIRQSILEQTAQFQQDGLTKSVAHTYVQLYALCQVQWMAERRDNIPGTLLPSISSMATTCSDVRGLEDRLVPWLGIRRRVERIKIIRAVIKAQQQKASCQDVASLSQLLTEPARQMGQAVAVADATAAILEYGG